MLRRYIILLFVIVSLPLLASMVRLDAPLTFRENRELVSPPHLSDIAKGTIFTATENYVSDHFGLRYALVAMRNYILVVLFHSPPPLPLVSVIYGTTGRLYLIGVEHLLPPRVLTDPDAVLLAGFFSREAGIYPNAHYVFFVVPNTWSIYPDGLPAAVKKLFDTPSVYEQFLQYYRAHGALFSMIDVHDDMVSDARTRELAGDTPLYYTYDHHWNAEGEMIGYQRLLSDLSAKDRCLKPLSQNSFFKKQEQNASDIADLYALGSVLYDSTYSYGHTPPLKPACPSSRIAIIGDSMFARHMVKMLESQGLQVLFINLQGKNGVLMSAVQAQILAFKPTIVIDELSEETFSTLVDEYVNAGTSASLLIR